MGSPPDAAAGGHGGPAGGGGSGGGGGGGASGGGGGGLACTSYPNPNNCAPPACTNDVDDAPATCVGGVWVCTPPAPNPPPRDCYRGTPGGSCDPDPVERVCGFPPSYRCPPGTVTIDGCACFGGTDAGACPVYGGGGDQVAPPRG